ncbi:MAG: septal ring factor EnvC (AmiA/AmiB activator), partial [Algoriphagus sp.]
MFRKFILVAFFIAGLFSLQGSELSAQTKKSREELEREKAAVQERLKEFDAILRKTTASKKSTIGELNAITRQFQTQTRLVNTLDREVKLINQEINETESKISSLEAELIDLKAEYGRMIYNASKLNRGLSIVAFVFSSGNFNQLYARLMYLKQYTDSRKQQAIQIGKLSQELSGQRITLDQRKSEKVKVLSEEQKERQELDRLKQTQQGVVNTLSK